MQSAVKKNPYNLTKTNIAEQYQAEQAEPEHTEEVHEDLDNEDLLEPHHHDYNTRAETVYTTVRDLWSHHFSFK